MQQRRDGLSWRCFYLHNSRSHLNPCCARRIMSIVDFLYLSIFIIGATVAAVLVAIAVYRLKFGKRSIINTFDTSNELAVINPQTAHYEGWSNRFGRTETIGTIAMSDQRIIFVRVFGEDINIPLDEINTIGKYPSHIIINERVASKITYLVRGGSFLTLTLNDGTKASFVVKDIGQWEEALNTYQR